jgi:hypothetical protein
VCAGLAKMAMRPLELTKMNYIGARDNSLVLERNLKIGEGRQRRLQLVSYRRALFTFYKGAFLWLLASLGLVWPRIMIEVRRRVVGSSCANPHEISLISQRRTRPFTLIHEWVHFKDPS